MCGSKGLLPRFVRLYPTDMDSLEVNIFIIIRKHCFLLSNHIGSKFDFPYKFSRKLAFIVFLDS